MVMRCVELCWPYYTPADINDAKRTIADLFRSTFDGIIMTTDRRNSTVRSAHEAEVDDIIAMLDLLDEKHLLQTVLFLASDLERLPKYGPEEINICTVVDNQQKLSCNVDKLAAEVEQLKYSDASVLPASVTDTVGLIDTALLNFQQRIEHFQTFVNTRIEYLNFICTQFSHSVAVNVNSGVADNVDRSSNLVVFGIPENRNVSIWRNKIDDVFHFIVGRNVEIGDAYRLGSYRDGKVRPILVKLASAWDRRLILGSCKKLKDYTERVFVRPDEPVDTRRKKTLDRLKWKAEQENKSVVVNDGILSIDGVDVYSLRSGMIRDDDAANHHG
jgi:hypothetical protein